MANTISEGKPIPRSEADLRFDEKSKVQPKGFKDLEIDEMVTITVTGKVKSLSAYQYRKGEGNKNLSIQLSSCVIGKGNVKESGVGYQSDKD